MTLAEPTIIGAVVVAGHDGQAELAVDIRYPNGAVRQTVFPVGALGPVLDAAGVGALDELVGAPWSVLLAGRRSSPSCPSPSSSAAADDHAPPAPLAPANPGSLTPSPSPSPSPWEAPTCST